MIACTGTFVPGTILANSYGIRYWERVHAAGAEKPFRMPTSLAGCEFSPSEYAVESLAIRKLPRNTPVQDLRLPSEINEPVDGVLVTATRMSRR